MRVFDTIILGSGYFSLGYALKSENTLVIEKTQLADPTFCGTLSGFSFEKKSIWDNETKQLYAFYLDSKIANDVRLNSSVSEVGLCAYIAKRKPDILLGTECIDIQKCDIGYKLTVFNNAGYSKLYSKKLIDARRLDEKKYLNVLCRGNAEKITFLNPENAKLRVTGAFESDEFVLEFCFRDTINVNSAKIEAMRYFENELSKSGAEIVQFAYLMHSEPSLVAFEEAEVPVIREISFLDVFSAFDAGVKYAKERVK